MTRMEASTQRRSRQSGEQRISAGPDSLLRHAVAYWQSGDFDLCLHALDELANEYSFARYTPDAVLLRARALLRLMSIEETREWLVLNATRFAEPIGDASATHSMLLGQVHADLRAYDDAEKCFAFARSCKPHGGILGEIEYSQALALYQQGLFDAAKTQVETALKSAEDILTARAHALNGWIAIARGSYVEAHRNFQQAIDGLAVSSMRDVHLHASIINALAISVAEVQTRAEDLGRLDTEASKLRWPTSLAGIHIQTLRHLGLAYLHAGDVSTAITRFVAAADVAPDTPWSLFGYLECANVAISRGEEVGPLALARKAVSLADRTNWKVIGGEQRLALLLLAQVLARLGDGARAASYRQKYYEQHAGMSNMSALGHDTRLATWEAHVEGCVEGALGKRERAALIFETVQAKWTDINYCWRAEEAKEDLRRVNPLRDPHRTMLVRPQLSLRDEQFVRLVVEGKTNEELAEHFHIAKNTVKNNLVRIYSEFQVGNRTQLVVAARHLAPSAKSYSRPVVNERRRAVTKSDDRVHGPVV
jgi:DNA-binding NarL/FixJ family response regulator